MWIAETIDLDNHDSVVKFMRNQSDKIKKLEKENEQLKETIETQNFNYKNAKEIIHSSERQIQQLQDELEQCKAVIDKKWSEYLQKKGLIE